MELIPKCETITKLSAVCVNCGKDASFTARTIEDEKVELIGGEDLYMPFCRKCFFQNEDNKKKPLLNLTAISTESSVKDKNSPTTSYELETKSVSSNKENIPPKSQLNTTITTLS